MSQFYDTILVLTTQVVLLIGFIFLLKFWYRKKQNIYPIITYWVLGLFFVLLMSFNLVLWVFNMTFQNENNLLDDQTRKSISVVLAIGFYIYIGTKYLKKQTLK